MPRDFPRRNDLPSRKFARHSIIRPRTRDILVSLMDICVPLGTQQRDASARFYSRCSMYLSGLRQSRVSPQPRRYPIKIYPFPFYGGSRTIAPRLPSPLVSLLLLTVSSENGICRAEQGGCLTPPGALFAVLFTPFTMKSIVHPVLSRRSVLFMRVRLLCSV